MHTLIKTTSLALLAAFTLTTQADFNEKPILGSLRLGCPSTRPIQRNNYTLQDRAFNIVGLARISEDDDNDQIRGLSWVQGDEVIDERRNRTLSKAFYLGTPPDLDLAATRTRGCAAFMHGEASRLQFTRSRMGTETRSGTCGDVLEESCIDAIVRRARRVETPGDDEEDFCEAFAEAMKRDFEECSGHTAENITVKAISGPGAPRPLTDEGNSTTTCWPVVPKEHDLTLIEDTAEGADYQMGTLLQFFGGVTPIVTVFFGNEGNNNDSSSNNSFVSETSAHLTCLKGVDEAHLDDPSFQPSGEDNAALSGFGSVGRGLTFVLVISTWTLFVALGF